MICKQGLNKQMEAKEGVGPGGQEEMHAGLILLAFIQHPYMERQDLGG